MHGHLHARDAEIIAVAVGGGAGLVGLLVFIALRRR
jgi:hypothetical protein